MADLSDVEAALVSLIAGAVYPGGTSQQSAIVLANGSAPNVRVFPGWPNSAQLDQDMAASLVNISVFAPPGLERPVKAYPREWIDQATTTPTITATVAGQAVTLGGTVTVGHYVTIVIGTAAFSYAAQAGDSLASVAAALVAQMPETLQASAAGPAITILATTPLTVRAGAPVTVIRELKRQQRRFTVTIWAPTNDARVATAQVVGPALAETDRLLLTSDNTLAHLVYAGENDIDRSGKQSTMCRDMAWTVEYATTQTSTGYPVTAFQTSLATTDGTPAGATLTQSG